jgi:hypothetical protein
MMKENVNLRVEFSYLKFLCFAVSIHSIKDDILSINKILLIICYHYNKDYIQH